MLNEEVQSHKREKIGAPQGPVMDDDDDDDNDDSYTDDDDEAGQWQRGRLAA